MKIELTDDNERERKRKKSISNTHFFLIFRVRQDKIDVDYSYGPFFEYVRLELFVYLTRNAKGNFKLYMKKENENKNTVSQTDRDLLFDCKYSIPNSLFTTSKQ